MKKSYLSKKILIAFCFTFIIIFGFLPALNAQSTNLTIDQTCINQINNGCPTFSNTCNSYSGWTSSHGTPQIVFWYNVKIDHFYAQMIATSAGGEGMFKPFPFIAGQTYSITVSFSTTGNPGSLTLYAANNLHQQFSNSDCQESPQSNNSKQLIGTVYNNSPITFTANSNYSQYWMFASLLSGTQSNIIVTNITINPVCNVGAPTGLTTSNNGSTLNWNAVNGASSYQIMVYDTHNGGTTEQTLNSNTNSVNYCAQAPGDNVRFVVFAVCGNNGLSPSTEYSYIFPNYAFPQKASGVNVTSLTSTSAVLNWNSQPNVFFFGTINGPGGTTFSTYGNSVQFTGLQANTSYYCQISAVNNCGGAGITEFRFTTLADCPTPTGGIYAQNANNSFYIYLQTPPTGCISYTLKYRIYGTTQEYIVPNIPTSSPYIITNLMHGQSYQFAIQCNCSAGATSLFGPWSTPSYYGRIAQIPSVEDKRKNLPDSISLDYHQDSLLTKKDVNKLSSDLVLYPNPAESEITISFENQEKAKSELIIVNSLGKEVLRKNLVNENSKGIQYEKIDVSEFSNGVYILKLKLGAKVLIQNLVIQR